MKSSGNAGLCLQLFSPDLCVGFLFLVVRSRLPPPACLLLPPPASSSQLVQTQLAHTQLAHTQLTPTHTQLVHTQLTHTHTHNLLHFAWQEWRLWRWTGSGGGLGSQWTPRSPRLFELLGVALGMQLMALACRSWLHTYIHTYIHYHTLHYITFHYIPYHNIT